LFICYDAFFPEATRSFDPLGKILASIDDEKDGIIHASLDYDIAKQMKHDYYTMLTERRPDIYIA
jgi:predicted amidohydrolase